MAWRGALFILLLAASVSALPPLVVWKCIHYRPAPLGSFVRSGLGDVYRDTFSAHFDRDLPLIANTGANCLTLDEWNSDHDHAKFLNKAAAMGLYVIPNFGLNSQKFPDLFTASAQQYVLEKFHDFLKPLVGWKSVIPMIQLGEGANRNFSDGGYQPLSTLTAFLPRMAALRTTVLGASPKVGFLVPMRSASVGVPATLAQIEDNDTPNVDYWGLDASTDWTALSTVTVQKLIVTMEMTNYDDGDINEQTQSDALKKQLAQLELYGASSVVGLSVFEWNDVNARKREYLGLSSEIFPVAYMDRRHDGITHQVFAQGRDCVKSRFAYQWVSATYAGVGWHGEELRCYPLVRLLPLAFILSALALGVIGIIVYTLGTCCIVRAQAKNAHVRYIPLAPDSRTDPYMVAIQSSLDSLLDAVLSGSMSMSLELLAANLLNNINLVQASLLKMVTNRRTKDAVEKRCETLRKLIETLKVYARLALAERPGDIEEDERLQAKAAEEVQRAQRDVKRIMQQMREELIELERLRDGDVRIEFGLSLRILGSPSTGVIDNKSWRAPVRMPSSGAVRMPSQGDRSSPKPQRRQSKTSLNV